MTEHRHYLGEVLVKCGLDPEPAASVLARAHKHYQGGRGGWYWPAVTDEEETDHEDQEATG